MTLKQFIIFSLSTVQKLFIVARFLGNLLKLLVFQNERFGAQIQKYVKELVGHELNPALYPILFDQIKVCVDKYFDSAGQVSGDIHIFTYSNLSIFIFVHVFIPRIFKLNIPLYHLPSLILNG